MEKLELFPVELEKGGMERRNEQLHPVTYTLYPVDPITHMREITFLIKGVMLLFFSFLFRVFILFLFQCCFIPVCISGPAIDDNSVTFSAWITLKD